MGHGRATDLRRRTETVNQHAAVLIATNGRSTEVTYFNAVKQEPWVRAGKIVVVHENGSPEEVVKGAERRRDRDDYDEAWAVCDVDEYDTAPATALATAGDVRLIWSNPCFEVWLLLHKGTCTAYIEDAKRAGARLRSHIRDWDKTALRFDDFRDGVEDALKRAKSLGEPPEANPSTAVWRVIEALK